MQPFLLCKLFIFVHSGTQIHSERIEFIFFFIFWILLLLVTYVEVVAMEDLTKQNKVIYFLCVFMCYIVLFISFFVILQYYQVDVLFYLVFGYIIEGK